MTLTLDQRYVPAAPLAPPVPATRKHRPDVEGLRAVAVLLVIGAHMALPGLSGGFIGVDVFFVISGFLITGQLLSELEPNGRISFLKFYARRARRILPAAAVVLVGTLAGSWYWLPALRARGVGLDGLAASVSVVNYRFAAQGVDYFSQALPPSPLQHYWSLGVEEQFYLVWPVLLVVASLAWKRILPSLRTVRVALLLIIAVSFYLSVTVTVDSPSWAYFAIHTRAWELALGALVAVCVPVLVRHPNAVPRWTSWLGLAMVTGGALLYTDRTPYPGDAAALPVLGTALVIAAGCARRSRAEVVLSIPGAQDIGRVSYSFYLWHFPLLIIAPSVLNHPLGLVNKFVLIDIALVLAVVTYNFIELPFRRSDMWVRRPWRGLTLWGGLSSVTAGAAVVLMGVAIPAGVGMATRAEASTVTTALSDGLRVQEVPANLTPSLEAAPRDRPVLETNGCLVQLEDSALRTDCVYGNPSSSTNVVMIGDSHMAQWFPALDRVAKERDWRLLVLTKVGCSPHVILNKYSTFLRRPYRECDEWRGRAFAYVRQIRPAAVLMAGLVKGEDQIGGMVQAIGALKPSGARLLLLRDTPYPGADVPTCVSGNLNDVGACNLHEAEAHVDKANEDRTVELAAAAGVSVIDPLPWFCQRGECPVVVGDMLVYHDESHVSATYAAWLAPLMSRALAPGVVGVN